MESIWKMTNSDNGDAVYFVQKEPDSNECGYLRRLEDGQWDYALSECSLNVNGVIYYTDLVQGIIILMQSKMSYTLLSV